MFVSNEKFTIQIPIVRIVSKFLIRINSKTILYKRNELIRIPLRIR